VTANDTLDVLLQAILDEPDVDLHRLVFADALEESGEWDRAEFVRVQLGIECMGGYGSCQNPRRGTSTVGCGECPLCVLCRRQDALFTGERFWNWFGAAGAGMPGTPGVGWTDDLTCVVGYGTLHRANRTVTVRRGFVAGITLPCRAFLAHAGAIFRAHPVERVTLAGKHPAADAAGAPCAWFHRDDDRQPDDLPPALFRLLSGGRETEPGHPSGIWYREYGSEAAALADLHAACLRYGRQKRREAAP
jgi:uncharacterized protein (TIGR02996 family)